jgi:tetratricopeptide (TPR) repeat protein
MSLIYSLLRYFGIGAKQQREDAQINRLWLEGHKAFCLAKDFYDKRQLEEAINCFDLALEYGYDDNVDLYFMRGWCLQNTGYDLDAIDDFDKAIALEAEDGNYLFLRSISKWSSGDLLGRIADLKEAIRLVSMDNVYNRAYDTYAQEQGYTNCAQFFQAHLNRALSDLDFFQEAYDPDNRWCAHKKELLEKRSNKKRRPLIKNSSD